MSNPEVNNIRVSNNIYKDNNDGINILTTFTVIISDDKWKVKMFDVLSARNEFNTKISDLITELTLTEINIPYIISFTKLDESNRELLIIYEITLHHNIVSIQRIEIPSNNNNNILSIKLI
jgi:hypothetical protein